MKLYTFCARPFKKELPYFNGFALDVWIEVPETNTLNTRENGSVCFELHNVVVCTNPKNVNARSLAGRALDIVS